jgi:hypothetical protein
MHNEDADEGIRRYEVIGELNAHAAEALRLEICWLAKHYGVEIRLHVEGPLEAGSRNLSMVRRRPYPAGSTTALRSRERASGRA